MRARPLARLTHSATGGGFLTNRRGRATTAIVLVMAIALQMCAFGAKKAQLNSKLGSVKKAIRAVKYKIHLKESEKRTVMGQLAIVQDKLDGAQEKLNASNLQFADASADLKATVQRLGRAKKQLNRRQTLLQRRIVDIYEGDDLNYVDVVLGSTDMWTFLSRAYYLQQILSADTTLIKTIRALKASIERDKANQTRRVAQIASLRGQLISERDQVSNLADSKQHQIDSIEHDKDLMERALAEFQAEEQGIEEQIRRIQSTPAGQKRLHTAFHGKFMLPVSGKLTCPFGYRHHPITGQYSFHTGEDLAVPSGTAVHASAAGVVTKAGWNKAYGYMVVIDHNGGYSTLYGHNSKLLVRVGDKVNQGQVIARSGSTGWSTGPHVHYQLMLNGSPINPGR